MYDDVPILEFDTGVCMYHTPDDWSQLEVQLQRITSNHTRGFCLTGCKLRLTHTAALQTTCAGLFCDKQRMQEIITKGYCCACYSSRTMVTDLIMAHDLTAYDAENQFLFKHKGFSSERFQLLYQTSSFPKSITIAKLNEINVIDSIENACKKMLKSINKRSGFTIQGWYKRGEMNDVGVEDNKIESDTVNYHITSISLSQKDDTQHIKKYDVRKLADSDQLHLSIAR